MFGIKQFDIVIGNPPYGSSINIESKNQLKKRFAYLIQRIPNSYLYFMGIGNDLLKANGIFSYIIPNEFLFQIYMEKARKYFLENSLIKVAINTGQDVFKAIVPSSIVIIQKSNIDDYLIAIKDLRGKTLNALTSELNTSSFDLLPSKQIYNSPNATFSFDAKKSKLVNSIISKYEPFVNYCDDIANGISTSCDSIYIVNDEFAEKHNLENRHLKSSIRGGQFNRYFCPETTGEKILYINTNYTPNLAPNIHKYLTDHKDLLIRKSVEKKSGIRDWHLLFRPRNEMLFKSPKIIIRQTGDTIIAAVDLWNHYCIDSVNVVQIKENHIDKLLFFIGVLNSKLIKFIYQEISQEKGRVLAQVKPQRIGQMPISLGNNHLVEKIATEVDKLINAQIDKSIITSIEEKIDQLVFELYSLTEVEISYILNELN